MTRNLLPTVATFGALLLLGGCASIISSGSQTVQIESNPSHARFELVDKKGKVIHSGTTPASVSLKRGRGYFQGNDLTLRVCAADGSTREVPVKSQLNAWYIGNLGFGGLVGLLVVDPLTGAMFCFPENVAVDLDATTAMRPQHTTLGPPRRDPGALRVVNLGDVPVDLRHLLVPVEAPAL